MVVIWAFSKAEEEHWATRESEDPRRRRSLRESESTDSRLSLGMRKRRGWEQGTRELQRRKSRGAGRQAAQAERLPIGEKKRGNHLAMQQQHGRISQTSRWAKEASHKGAHMNSIYVKFKAKLVYGDRNCTSEGSGWGGRWGKTGHGFALIVEGGWRAPGMHSAFVYVWKFQG